MLSEFMFGLGLLLLLAPACVYAFRRWLRQEDIVRPEPVLEGPRVPVRVGVANEVESAGQRVNEARLAAVNAEMPFVAGLLRGAEEAIKIAYDMLSNPGTPDSEL